MPDITNKEFNKTIETLSKMTNGVQQHKNDQDFPSAVKEEILTELKNSMDRLSQANSQAQAKATQAHDQLVTEHKHAKETLSSYRTMVYGYFGKKNTAVTDFGLQPYKTRKRKPPKTDNPTTPKE